MGTPYATVVTELTGYGAKEGDFNQGSFRTSAGVGDTYTNPYTHTEHNLTGGYCEGVCLDWIRRMLLTDADKWRSAGTGRMTYASVKPTGAHPARGESTVKRMAHAYARQGDYDRNYTQLASDLQRAIDAMNGVYRQGRTLGGTNRRFAEGVDIPKDVLERTLKLWDIKASWGITGTYATETVERSKVASLIVQCAAEGAGPAWNDLKGELDRRFNELRTAEGRGATSRPFSNLDLVTSAKTAFSSGEAWIASLFGNIRNVSFVAPGQAARISAILLAGGRRTGHAVAVWRVGDTFSFFDPNYGVFKYDAEGLKKALSYLFVRKPGPGVQKPIYGEDDSKVTNTFGHDVFGVTA